MSESEPVAGPMPGFIARRDLKPGELVTLADVRPIQIVEATADNLEEVWAARETNLLDDLRKR